MCQCQSKAKKVFSAGSQLLLAKLPQKQALIIGVSLMKTEQTQKKLFNLFRTSQNVHFQGGYISALQLSTLFIHLNIKTFKCVIKKHSSLILTVIRQTRDINGFSFSNIYFLTIQQLKQLLRDHAQFMVLNDSKVTRNFYELAFFFGHRSDSNSERLAMLSG